jgi:hypothetical protein
MKITLRALVAQTRNIDLLDNTFTGTTDFIVVRIQKLSVVYRATMNFILKSRVADHTGMNRLTCSNIGIVGSNPTGGMVACVLYFVFLFFCV